MDSIKTILINYAVCALWGSVFEFVAPRRSKETFRIVSGVVLISVVLIPLATFDFSGELKNYEVELDEEQNNENALLTTAGLMEKEIYKRVENILINFGVDEYEIYISTKTDEAANEVVLTEVNISVGERYQSKIGSLQGELSGEFGSVLKIGVKENDEN